MTQLSLHRRAALFAGLAAALTAAGRPTRAQDMAHAMPEGWVKPDKIAMLCYPGMTILDLIGPQYMFAALMGATVQLVGKTRDPMTSDTGVTIVPRSRPWRMTRPATSSRTGDRGRNTSPRSAPDR
jgi:hypothetical protein